MFTGIIDQVGIVDSVTKTDSGLELRIHVLYPDLALGESVAVNGVCLTVARLSNPQIPGFYLSHETIATSNLGSVRAGTRLNLERSLPATGRLSGHMVLGHVDGVGKLVDLCSDGESHDLRFEISEKLLRYCVYKGSIAINGVSLTINSVEADAHASGQVGRVGITIIPHTWSQTNFSDLKPGAEPESLVNVEVDILAKYMERLCQPYLSRHV